MFSFGVVPGAVAAVMLGVLDADFPGFLLDLLSHLHLYIVWPTTILVTKTKPTFLVCQLLQMLCFGSASLILKLKSVSTLLLVLLCHVLFVKQFSCVLSHTAKIFSTFCCESIVDDCFDDRFVGAI